VIKQLVLATNFGAVFVDEESGELWVDTIVAWALVANPTAPGESVLGMVADGKEIVFADDFPNFAGYLSPDSSLDEWKRRLEEEANAGPVDDSVLIPKPRGKW
jgi:hypothetical protein